MKRDADAQLAGYASLAELRAALAMYDGPLYRVELGVLRADRAPAVPAVEVSFCAGG